MSMLQHQRAIRPSDGEPQDYLGAQGLVATRLVDASIVIEIAERGGQAVGTMFDGHPAERPKCVLQADGKRGETLAAERRLGVLPGRVSQHEMIQPMVQCLAGDADAGVGHVGEIRQRLLSRRSSEPSSTHFANTL